MSKNVPAPVKRTVELTPVFAACRNLIYDINTAWRAAQPTPQPYRPFKTVIHGKYAAPRSRK